MNGCASCTKHASERMAQRGFDELDIVAITSSSRQYEQTSGEIVHIAQMGPDVYNVVIREGDRIVLAMRGKTYHQELKGLQPGINGTDSHEIDL